MQIIKLPKTPPFYVKRKAIPLTPKKFLKNIFNNYRNFRKYVKGELL